MGGGRAEARRVPCGRGEAEAAGRAERHREKGGGLNAAPVAGVTGYGPADAERGRGGLRAVSGGFAPHHCLGGWLL